MPRHFYIRPYFKGPFNDITAIRKIIAKRYIFGAEKVTLRITRKSVTIVSTENNTTTILQIPKGPDFLLYSTTKFFPGTRRRIARTYDQFFYPLPREFFNITFTGD